MELPRKRQRTSSTSSADTTLGGALPTPPSNDPPALRHKILSRAQHVLTTEAAALCWVSNLYQTSTVAIDGLCNGVQAILDCQTAGGKVIVCGVGKSAYIGMKLVATCKSLGIAASFLHACEAVHGDLGDVRPIDVVLFVSFSGKTPELMQTLLHLPEGTVVMALSSHLHAEKCMLLLDRPDSILLPAPIPEPEETSFGLCAPTTSTTVALAVADMLALSVADQMHGSNSKEVFKRNHPGGAIGMNHREIDTLKKADVKLEVLELPSPSISAESDD
ncbi:hypothetical protein AMS68_006938 [Peltaster fructicola]|uniref:SIS domain-containing protein n=1 Tax=Peltaster fructicola TaxID=286661 RepID=A0A6H0Y3D5_9PEZI|nr:hypothetical protein AMS68_006938 [Peltaster fructicola]